MTGNVAPRKAGAPFPVVVFFNGSTWAGGYHWLAVALAERGLAVVTFGWVGEDHPGCDRG